MKKTLFKWLFVALLVMAGFTLSWAGSGDPVLENKAITGTLGFDTGTTINEFSTDGTFAGDSDGVVPTEKAVKTYGDANWAGSATAWDDIGNPDAASEVDMGNHITEIKLGASGDFRIGDGGTDYTKFGADGVMSFVGASKLTLQSSNVSPNSTGEIRHDSTVAGLMTGSLAWWDGDEVRYLVDLDVLPSSDDYVVSYDATNDKFYMKADATGGGSLPAGSQGDMLYKGASAWLAGQVVFTPGMYTGTDTQKIQAAIDAAEALKTWKASGNWYGGRVHIPTGVWSLTASLTVNKPITIYGDGSQATILRATNGNFKIFHVNNEGSTVIRDMKIEDSGTATSGSAAIYVEYTGGSYNDRSRFDNLIFSRTYDGIYFAEGYGSQVTRCRLSHIKRYGIFQANSSEPDGGDNLVADCTFDHSTAADHATAIRWESGGGYRIINNKFVGDWDYFVHFEVDNAASPEVNTGDLIITGNSFENPQLWHIECDTEGVNGIFHDIQINGNQFASWAGSNGKGIKIDTHGANTVYNVNITDNNFDNCGIETVDGENIFISSNLFAKGVGANITYAVNNTGATYVRLGMNVFTGYAFGNRNNGTFHHDILMGSCLQINGVNPGFWLDETDGGVKGAYAVVDGGVFQIQRRATNFGAYEAGLFTLNITSGNLYALGTITAGGSCCPDYVFEDSYELITLSELSTYIEQNESLPGITFSCGNELNLNLAIEELMVKTEEQALYILQLHERLKALENHVH